LPKWWYSVGAVTWASAPTARVVNRLAPSPSSTASAAATILSRVVMPFLYRRYSRKSIAGTARSPGKPARRPRPAAIRLAHPCPLPYTIHN